MKKVILILLFSVISLLASNEISNKYVFKKIGIVIYQEGEFSQKPTVTEITGYIVYINEMTFRCNKDILNYPKDDSNNYQCYLDNSVTNVSLNFPIYLVENPTGYEIFESIVQKLK